MELRDDQTSVGHGADEASELPSAPLRVPETPDPQAPPEAPRAFSALRHRNFRVFYVGHVLSLTGTWMQTTAQGWLVLELTNSEFKLGLVTAVASLPTLFLGLYAGVVADRRDKRRIILTAQWTMLVCALAIAVLTGTHTITYPVLLGLVFVLGTASAFEIPTRQSFFAEIVEKRDLANAIALNSAAFNGSRIIGPAVAGALIGGAGVAACFYANAFSYVAVIAGLMMLRIAPFRPNPATADASVLDHLREGVAYIRADRVVQTLVLMIAAMSVTVFPYSMLLPVFARDVLHVGAHGLGMLLSAAGAGALSASVLLAAGKMALHRGKLIVGACLAFVLLLIGFALSTWYPLSLALLAAASFMIVLNNATLNALLQARVPDRLRGRVMSVYVFMFVGMTPLGSLQAGALARWLQAPAALAIGCGVMLLILGLVVLRVPELLIAE